MINRYKYNFCRWSCSVAKSNLTLCNSMDCSTPGFPVLCLPDFLKFMSIESVMPSNHLILSCPILLLPSIFTSIRVFSSESVLHIWWPKYQSFSFSMRPSNEYSGLISFRSDWFDLVDGGILLNRKQAGAHCGGDDSVYSWAMRSSGQSWLETVPGK